MYDAFLEYRSGPAVPHAFCISSNAQSAANDYRTQINTTPLQVPSTPLLTRPRAPQNANSVFHGTRDDLSRASEHIKPG